MSTDCRISRVLVLLSTLFVLPLLSGCGTTFFVAVEDEAGLPVADTQVVISNRRMLDVFQLRAGWGKTDEHGVTNPMTIERFQVGSRVQIEVRHTSGAEWRGTLQVDVLPLEMTTIELSPIPAYGREDRVEADHDLRVTVWSRGAKEPIYPPATAK
jgi:hypothetical protein